MNKEKSFETFFNVNKNKLPYYFKDFKTINLEVNDNTVFNKVFRSSQLNGTSKVEKFYKQILRIE